MLELLALFCGITLGCVLLWLCGIAIYCALERIVAIIDSIGHALSRLVYGNKALAPPTGRPKRS